MKYLLIGAFLVFCSGIYSQSFVDNPTAEVIISQKIQDDNQDLEDLDESTIEFEQLKNNLRAYEIFTAHNNSLVVEESIMMAVMEVKESTLSIQDYETNNISDPELLRIKNHLINLLSD